MKTFFGGKIGQATPLDTLGDQVYNTTSPLQINESHEVESSYYDTMSLADGSIQRLSSADLLTDHGNESPKKANNDLLNRARDRVQITPMPAKT